MKFYGTLAALTAMVLSLSAVTVDPGKAVIVVKKDADGVIQFAGKELQKYHVMIQSCSKWETKIIWNILKI